MRTAFVLVLSVVVLLVSLRSARSNEEGVVGVRVVAFSPDGKLLAAGTGEPQDPGTVMVWDTTTRQPRWTHREAQGVPSLAFSPDGRTLAIGTFGPAAKLLDSATGQVRATFAGNGKTARAVGFSPDGATLAVGSYDRFIKLWDVASGKELKTLNGHTDRVFTVEFSPDGKRLVSASVDMARLWDATTGKEVRTLSHDGFLTHAALFTPDGRSVLTGGWDGTIRLWDAATGVQRFRFQNLGGVDALAFSPAIHTLAESGGGRVIHLFDLNMREPTREEREHLRTLLVKLDDPAYDVREAAGQALLEVGFLAEPELRRAAQESPSAEVRIRARRLRQVLLSTPRGMLDGHTADVECVAFAQDGKILASASKDGTVRVWDVSARKELARFTPAAR
jgi:WD40 repeat protein